MKKMSLMSLLIAALLAAGTLSPALAGDHDDARIEKRVVVEVHEDDEHDGEPHRAVFINEKGEAHNASGKSIWVGHHADGPGAMAFRFGGSHGFLGVQLTDITAELRTHLGAPEEAGVLVSRVVEDTPAARAGVRVGDIIARVDGTDVGSSMDLRHQIMKREDGEVVTLEVWRDGLVLQLDSSIEVREMPGMGFQTRMHTCDDDEECGEHMMVIDMDCDDDEGCGHVQWIGEECEGEGPCEIQIRCEDEGCTCTANGADVDCPEHIGHHN